MAFNLTAQLNIALNSASLRAASNQLNTALNSNTQVKLGIDRNSSSGFKQIKSQIDESTNAMESFGKQSGLAAKRFAAFSVTAGAFIAFTAAAKEAVSAAIDFDFQMVKLGQVSSSSGNEIKNVASEITRLATNYGVSSKELGTVAITLKQANLSLADTKIALESLAQAALAPNFENLKDTTEGAIAIMNQFKIEAKDLGVALGSVNAVAGEFAVEAGDIIEAIRKTGGAFKAAGGNLNELIALFTSVRQTTRESAESISTGLRTIFTRIQRNDTVEALRAVNIQLRYTSDEARALGDAKLENQFVGPYEAVKRLSAGLKGLQSTDPRFSAIVEQLGGYRQISKVIPLINEFATAQKALGIAQAGSTSLSINAGQAQDALIIKFQKLKETFLEVGRNIVNSPGFQSLVTTFISASSSVLGLIDSLKGLLPLITALAAVKLFQGAASFTKGFLSAGSDKKDKKAEGGFLRMRTGGIVPGSGSGDKVRALLEPGELVVPRNQVARQKFSEGDKAKPKKQVFPSFPEYTSTELTKSKNANRIKSNREIRRKESIAFKENIDANSPVTIDIQDFGEKFQGSSIYYKKNDSAIPKSGKQYIESGANFTLNQKKHTAQKNIIIEDSVIKGYEVQIAKRGKISNDTNNLLGINKERDKFNQYPQKAILYSTLKKYSDAYGFINKNATNTTDGETLLNQLGIKLEIGEKLSAKQKKVYTNKLLNKATKEIDEKLQLNTNNLGKPINTPKAQRENTRGIIVNFRSFGKQKDQQSFASGTTSKGTEQSTSKNPIENLEGYLLERYVSQMTGKKIEGSNERFDFKGVLPSFFSALRITGSNNEPFVDAKRTSGLTKSVFEKQLGTGTIAKEIIKRLKKKKAIKAALGGLINRQRFMNGKEVKPESEFLKNTFQPGYPALKDALKESGSLRYLRPIQSSAGRKGVFTLPFEVLASSNDKDFWAETEGNLGKRKTDQFRRFYERKTGIEIGQKKYSDERRAKNPLALPEANPKYSEALQASIQKQEESQNRRIAKSFYAYKEDYDKNNTASTENRILQEKYISRTMGSFSPSTGVSKVYRKPENFNPKEERNTLKHERIHAIQKDSLRSDSPLKNSLFNTAGQERESSYFATPTPGKQTFLAEVQANYGAESNPSDKRKAALEFAGSKYEAKSYESKYHMDIADRMRMSTFDRSVIRSEGHKEKISREGSDNPEVIAAKEALRNILYKQPKKPNKKYNAIISEAHRILKEKIDNSRGPNWEKRYNAASEIASNKSWEQMSRKIGLSQKLAFGGSVNRQRFMEGEEVTHRKEFLDNSFNPGMKLKSALQDTPRIIFKRQPRENEKFLNMDHTSPHFEQFAEMYVGSRKASQLKRAVEYQRLHQEALKNNDVESASKYDKLNKLPANMRLFAAAKALPSAQEKARTNSFEDGNFDDQKNLLVNYSGKKTTTRHELGAHAAAYGASKEGSPLANSLFGSIGRRMGAYGKGSGETTLISEMQAHTIQSSKQKDKINSLKEFISSEKMAKLYKSEAHGTLADSMQKGSEIPTAGVLGGKHKDIEIDVLKRMIQDAYGDNPEVLAEKMSALNPTDSSNKVNFGALFADSKKSKRYALGGPIIRMKKGGIVPGSGSGDKVRALLEPGELVIPKHQVARQKFGGGGPQKLTVGDKSVLLGVSLGVVGGLAPFAASLFGMESVIGEDAGPLVGIGYVLASTATMLGSAFGFGKLGYESGKKIFSSPKQIEEKKQAKKLEAESKIRKQYEKRNIADRRSILLPVGGEEGSNIKPHFVTVQELSRSRAPDSGKPLKDFSSSDTYDARKNIELKGERRKQRFAEKYLGIKKAKGIFGGLRDMFSKLNGPSLLKPNLKKDPKTGKLVSDTKEFQKFQYERQVKRGHREYVNQAGRRTDEDEPTAKPVVSTPTAKPVVSTPTAKPVVSTPTAKPVVSAPVPKPTATTPIPTAKPKPTAKPVVKPKNLEEFTNALSPKQLADFKEKIKEAKKIIVNARTSGSMKLKSVGFNFLGTKFNLVPNKDIADKGTTKPTEEKPTYDLKGVKSLDELLSKLPPKHSEGLRAKIGRAQDKFLETKDIKGLKFNYDFGDKRGALNIQIDKDLIKFGTIGSFPWKPKTPKEKRTEELRVATERNAKKKATNMARTASTVDAAKAKTDNASSLTDIISGIDQENQQAKTFGIARDTKVFEGSDQYKELQKKLAAVRETRRMDETQSLVGSTDYNMGDISKGLSPSVYNLGYENKNLGRYKIEDALNRVKEDELVNPKEQLSLNNPLQDKIFQRSQLRRSERSQAEKPIGINENYKAPQEQQQKDIIGTSPQAQRLRQQEEDREYDYKEISQKPKERQSKFNAEKPIIGTSPQATMLQREQKERELDNSQPIGIAQETTNNISQKVSDRTYPSYGLKTIPAIIGTSPQAIKLRKQQESAGYRTDEISSKTVAPAAIPAVPPITQAASSAIAGTSAQAQELRKRLNATNPGEDFRDKTKTLTGNNLAEILSEPTVKPKVKKRAKKENMSLISLVIKAGGIKPESIKKDFNYKRDIQGYGLTTAMRKNGQGIDVIADSLERNGHFVTPESRHSDEYLLELLQGKKSSILEDRTKEIEEEERRYYEQREASQREESGTTKRKRRGKPPEEVIPFAKGGLVPGTGNSDTVPMDLPEGSFVIRKSSVNKIGADNLAKASRFASGGTVPALVMPGEYIYSPQEASKIGSSKLHAMNKLAKFARGGSVKLGKGGTPLSEDNTFDPADPIKMARLAKQLVDQQMQNNPDLTRSQARTKAATSYNDIKTKGETLVDTSKEATRLKDQLEKSTKSLEDQEKKVQDAGKAIAGLSQAQRKQEAYIRANPGDANAQKKLDRIKSQLADKLKEERSEKSRLVPLKQTVAADQAQYKTAQDAESRAKVDLDQYKVNKSGEVTKNNKVVGEQSSRGPGSISDIVKQKTTKFETTFGRKATKEDKINLKQEALGEYRTGVEKQVRADAVKRGKPVNDIQVQSVVDNYVNQASKGQRKLMTNAQGEITGDTGLGKKLVGGGYKETGELTKGGALKDLGSRALFGAKRTDFETGSEGDQQFKQSQGQTVANKLIGGAAVAGFVSDRMSKSAGKPEDFITPNGGGPSEPPDPSKVEAYKSTMAFAGALTKGTTYAAAAGQALAQYGPLVAGAGAAIAGLAGAIQGYFDALEEAEKAIREQKIAVGLKNLEDIYASVANGLVEVNSATIRNIQSNQEDIQKNKSEQLVADAGGNTSGFSSFLNTVSFGALGKEAYDPKKLADSTNKSRKEDDARAVTQSTMVLNKLSSTLGKDSAKELKASGKDITATSFEDAKPELLRKLRDENSGFGKAEISKIASTQNISIPDAEKQFLAAMKDAFESEKAKGVSLKQIETNNRTIASMTLLSGAVNAAAAAADNFNARLSLNDDLFEGNTGSTKITSQADRIGMSGSNPNFSQFNSAISESSGLLGDYGQSFKAQGNAVNVASQILPEILANSAANPVSGKDPSAQIVDALRAGLKERGITGAEADKVVNSVGGKVSAEEFTKQLAEAGGDVGKATEKLLSDIKDPLVAAFKDIDAKLTEQSQAYISGLENLAKRQNQILQEFDKLAGLNSQQSSFRASEAQRSPNARYGAEESRALDVARNAQAEKQMRLTGLGRGGSQDSGIIAAKLKETEKRAEKQSSALELTSKDKQGGSAFRDAALELTKTKNEAANLKTALKNLTDQSGLLQAAQQKLASVRSGIDDKRSFGKKLLTQTPEDQDKMLQGQAIFNQVKSQGGSLRGMSTEQNAVLFQFLENFGAAGKKIEDQILDANGYGASQDDLSEEKALVALHDRLYQEQINAQQLYIVSQQGLQNEYFTKLEDKNKTFYSNLEKFTQELTKNEKSVEKNKEKQKLAKIEDVQKNAEPLAKAGITNKADFELLNKNRPQVQELANTKIEKMELLKASKAEINTTVERTATGAPKNTPTISNELKNAGYRENQITQIITEITKGKSLASARKSVETSETGSLIQKEEKQTNALKGNQKLIDVSNSLASGEISSETMNRALENIRELGVGTEELSVSAQEARANIKRLENEISNLGGTQVGIQQNPQPTPPKPVGLTLADGGSVFTPRGTDTVPAMLTPGEFVVNRNATQQNLPLLRSINSGATSYLSGGGQVGYYGEGTNDPIPAQKPTNINFEDSTSYKDFLKIREEQNIKFKEKSKDFKEKYFDHNKNEKNIEYYTDKGDYSTWGGTIDSYVYPYINTLERKVFSSGIGREFNRAIEDSNLEFEENKKNNYKNEKENRRSDIGWYKSYYKLDQKNKPKTLENYNKEIAIIKKESVNQNVGGAVLNNTIRAIPRLFNAMPFRMTAETWDLHFGEESKIQKKYNLTNENKQDLLNAEGSLISGDGTFGFASGPFYKEEKKTYEDKMGAENLAKAKAIKDRVMGGINVASQGVTSFLNDMNEQKLNKSKGFNQVTLVGGPLQKSTDIDRQKKAYGGEDFKKNYIENGFYKRDIGVTADEKGQNVDNLQKYVDQGNFRTEDELYQGRRGSAADMAKIFLQRQAQAQIIVGTLMNQKNQELPDHLKSFDEFKKYKNNIKNIDLDDKWPTDIMGSVAGNQPTPEIEEKKKKYYEAELAEYKKKNTTPIINPVDAYNQGKIELDKVIGGKEPSSIAKEKLTGINPNQKMLVSSYLKLNSFDNASKLKGRDLVNLTDKYKSLVSEVAYETKDASGKPVKGKKIEFTGSIDKIYAEQIKKRGQAKDIGGDEDFIKASVDGEVNLLKLLGPNIFDINMKRSILKNEDKNVLDTAAAIEQKMVGSFVKFGTGKFNKDTNLFDGLFGKVEAPLDISNALFESVIPPKLYNTDLTNLPFKAEDKFLTASQILLKNAGNEVVGRKTLSRFGNFAFDYTATEANEMLLDSVQKDGALFKIMSAKNADGKWDRTATEILVENSKTQDRLSNLMKKVNTKTAGPAPAAGPADAFGANAAAPVDGANIDTFDPNGDPSKQIKQIQKEKQNTKAIEAKEAKTTRRDIKNLNKIDKPSTNIDPRRGPTRDEFQNDTVDLFKNFEELKNTAYIEKAKEYILSADSDKVVNTDQSLFENKKQTLYKKSNKRKNIKGFLSSSFDYFSREPNTTIKGLETDKPLIAKITNDFDSEPYTDKLDRYPELLAKIANFYKFGEQTEGSPEYVKSIAKLKNDAAVDNKAISMSVQNAQKMEQYYDLLIRQNNLLLEPPTAPVPVDSDPTNLTTPNDQTPLAKSKGGRINYLATGGSVPSYRANPNPSYFKPKGTDTVPAMLSPGEFVINAGATAKHSGLLSAINSGKDVGYSATGGPVSYLKLGKTRKQYQEKAKYDPKKLFDIDGNSSPQKLGDEIAGQLNNFKNKQASDLNERLRDESQQVEENLIGNIGTSNSLYARSGEKTKKVGEDDRFNNALAKADELGMGTSEVLPAGDYKAEKIVEQKKQEKKKGPTRPLDPPTNTTETTTTEPPLSGDPETRKKQQEDKIEAAAAAQRKKDAIAEEQIRRKKDYDAKIEARRQRAIENARLQAQLNAGGNAIPAAPAIGQAGAAAGVLGQQVMGGIQAGAGMLGNIMGGLNPLGQAGAGAGAVGAGIANPTTNLLEQLQNYFSENFIHLSSGGKSTATSDTIPAMLTPGEFVVNARSSAKNASLLHDINSGKDVEGFATGGSVGYYSGGKSSGGGKASDRLSSAASKLSEAANKLSDAASKINPSQTNVNPIVNSRDSSSFVEIKGSSFDKLTQVLNSGFKLNELSSVLKTEIRINQSDMGQLLGSMGTFGNSIGSFSTAIDKFSSSAINFNTEFVTALTNFDTYITNLKAAAALIPTQINIKGNINTNVSVGMDATTIQFAVQQVVQDVSDEMKRMINDAIDRSENGI